MQITRENPRCFRIETSIKALQTPFFFPSISTVKTNYDVYEYFNLLKKVSYPGFLISSYDIFHEKKRRSLIKDVSSVTEGRIFTLIDSGNYESYWSGDTSWSFSKFQSILKDINADLCFSYDVFWAKGKNFPQHLKETIKYAAMTAGAQKVGNTVPIVHCEQKNFRQMIRGLVKTINPQIIGITERELGASLFERAKTIKKIREELDKMGKDVPIHVLGTGNPISLLVYTFCGADLYDGLEWRNTVVNPSDAHLYHFIQKDLISCNCQACKIKNIPYHLQTMAHNLLFYIRFTDEIREGLTESNGLPLLKKYLPRHIHKALMKISGIS
jgi:tRNA-guanine family transglycosylase